MSTTSTGSTAPAEGATRPAQHPPAGAGTGAGTESPWALVAVREIVVRLTNKAFIVSTLVMIGLIGGSLGLQSYLGSRDEVMKVAVVDRAGRHVVEQAATAAKAADRHAVVKVEQVGDVDAAKEKVRAEKVDAYLVREKDRWQLVSRSSPSEKLTRFTREVVTQDALARNAAVAGTDVATLTKGADLQARALDARAAEVEKLAVAVAMLFSVLFMLSSMTFGMQIANSIVEEKASRVVEIVVAAIPVRHLLAGKVVGNTVMALGQIVLFVVVGLVGASLTEFRTMLPAIASASGWYVVFFLAGFLALACLWALAGALATRQEDLQATTSPMTTILMLSYFAGFMAKGTAMTVLSYVPVVSTTLMPVRLLRGEAQWWEAVLSLAVTLAFAVAAVLFSERLYRRSLLQTQGRLTIKQAMALQD